MKKLLAIILIISLLTSAFTVFANATTSERGNVVFNTDEEIVGTYTSYKPDALGNSIYEISLSVKPWMYNLDETKIYVGGEEISRYTLNIHRTLQPALPYISYNYIFASKPEDEIIVEAKASKIEENTKNDCVNFYLDDGLRAEVTEHIDKKSDYADYEISVGYRYSGYELNDYSIVLGNEAIPKFKKSESISSGYKNYTYTFSGNIDTVTVTGSSRQKGAEEYPLLRDIDAPKKISGDYVYAIDNNGYADLVKYIGKDNTPEIPEEIDGHKVKYIYSTFSDTQITEITIPDFIEVIGSKAFYYCRNLNKITINDGVKSIKENAFSNTALTSIEFPNSIEELSKNLFSGLKLDELKFGKNIKSVDYETFNNAFVETVYGYADTAAVMLADNDKIGNFKSLGVTYTVDDTKLLPSEELCNAVKNELLRLGYISCIKYITPEYLANSSLFTFYKDDLLHIKGSYYRDEYDDIGNYRFTTKYPLYAGNDNQCGYYIYLDGELKSIMYAYYKNLIDIDEIATLIPDTTTIETEPPAETTQPTSEPTTTDKTPITQKATISKNKVSLNAGKTATLNVKDGEVISWKSSDKKVATVKNGKVTALQKGTSVVTASLKNGQKLKADITVKTSPKLSKAVVSVKKGKTVDVIISGKANSLNNKYNKTKYAKVISKKSAKKIKIRGIKKGSTKLKIIVNGKTLTLKVKVK